MTAPDTEWKVQNAAQFTDRRYIMGREDCNGVERSDHTRSVRAFRAVVARRKDGKWEYERCPHAHRKPSAARKCAEAAAKRWNRKAEREAVTR